MSAPSVFSPSPFPLNPPSPKPSAWRLTAGLLLLGLGAALLLATRLVHADNWWALFILLPAVTLLAAAGPALVAQHPAARAVGRAVLGGGLIVLAVAVIFLIGLDWSIAWTLMLIVSGLVLILNALTGVPSGSLRHAFASLRGWAGLTTVLLGVTFLFDRLGFINLESLFGATRWWSAFILLPGLGATLHGLGLMALRREGSGAASLSGMGLVLCLTAAGEFVGLHERWALPLASILTGLALLLPALRSK